MIRILCFLALALVVSACTWRDRANDYRGAQLSKPIELPENVESEALHDSYRVPGIESHVVLPGAFEVPQPDPLVKDAELGVVRIQKMGEDRWILLAGTPGQIWPRLRGFLNLGGFPVVRTDAVNGIIETGWVQPRGDKPRERYRLRIEQGVQRGTSEIHVLQSAVQVEGDRWPRDSFSEAREQEMTLALAQYLADTEAASSVSMLAERNVDASGKIFLVGDERSEQYIRLLLPFDRAWASLAIALEKSGFVIDDRDRSQGRYWVSVSDDKKISQWFTRLVKDKDNVDREYFVDIQVLANDEMKISVKPQQRAAAETDPGVLDRILKQIKGYIS